MKRGSDFDPLEVRLHMTLDRLSNGESVEIKDELIDQAVDAFRASLVRQLRPEPRTFKLRASNIGRPLCQLQQEQSGTDKNRMPYNHIIRMLIGDATEAVVRLMLVASGANITAEKTQVAMVVNQTLVRGEDDIEIDDKVWDIKSSSPYLFQHKWAKGWSGIYYGDSFGYVPQLYVYAGGKREKMGGWITVDKSSGEVKVVHAEPTPDQMDEIKKKIHDNERAIYDHTPFVMQFGAEEETYYKKPTGNTVVPMVCTFCSYMGDCWPDAKLMPAQASKSENPKQVWYASIVPKEA